MPNRGNGSAPSQRNLLRAPLAYKAMKTRKKERVSVQLSEHLESNYRAVVKEPETCVIYALNGNP